MSNPPRPTRAAPPRVLTVAGSDSGGGAGIQGDLKTAAALGAYGMSVVTAVAAQNSLGTHGSWDLPEEAVRAQFRAVAGDLGVDAVKAEAPESAALTTTVADLLDGLDGGVPVVVDPGTPARPGGPPPPEALEALRQLLLPRATVLTPDLDEAARLTGIRATDEDGMREAAAALLAYGPDWVLLKGGGLAGAAADLLTDGTREHWYRSARHPGPHTRGAGGALATALAVHLARGASVPDATGAAKAYVSGAIAQGLPLGAGAGPVDHAWTSR